MNNIQRAEHAVQIELDEVYLETTTVSLESVPGRIDSRNTQILT